MTEREDPGQESAQALDGVSPKGGEPHTSNAASYLPSVASEEDVADYIASLLLVLRQMADEKEFHMLVHLLEMGLLETDRIRKSVGSGQPGRSTF